MRNFTTLDQPIVDAWQLIDHGGDQPVLLAEARNRCAWGLQATFNDPDLDRVSAALLRAGQRTRELARLTGTGIAVQIDGHGLPVFHRNPACAVAEGIDVATALELERQALLCEDLERCGIQKGGKAVRSPKTRPA